MNHGTGIDCETAGDDTPPCHARIPADDARAPLAKPLDGEKLLQRLRQSLARAASMNLTRGAAPRTGAGK